jgi:hypothetical protein
MESFLLYTFSISSLLVYIKATDYCKLILYPATLMNLFMVSRSYWVVFWGYLRYKIMSSAYRKSYWVVFWGYLRYKIMSSAYRNSFTTSLPICIAFIYSSCLIVLVRNFKTMLKGVGRVDALVLFLTLWEVVSVFPH